MTARLRQCLDAGEVAALFPLLKNWPKDELKALVKDVDEYGETVEKSISESHREAAFKPENFMSARRSKALDGAFEKAQMDALGVLVEISSVAQFYLGQPEST